MEELAEVMVMDRSTLGHNLPPLERDRLIKLDTHAADRRSRLVGLTKKGRHKLQKTTALWREMQARFESAFGAERTARLHEDGPVPPIMVKTEANPGGLPMEVFDEFRRD
jgi:DNA-binding MarR family transcriptional regulator